MPRTGTFENFYFDPDVFANYVDTLPFVNTSIIMSGVMQEDATIAELISGKGNVGTVPFYNPLDADADAPLNYNGNTDNVPVKIKGGKQTFMAIGRMKAWTDKDFTNELTGAHPLENVATKTNNYYQQVWQKKMMEAAEAAVSCTGMETHISDIAATDGSITEKNLITPTTCMDLAQKACGDMADRFSLEVVHSAILNAYKKAQLVEYVKYTDPRGLIPDVTLPTVDGKILIVNDRCTLDASHPGFPIYKTWLFGRGALLTATKALDNAYELKHDPEKAGGTNALYTKQARVIHPNGFSFKADNVVDESPTDEEWKNKSNWELKFDAKNIPIALLKTNG